VSAVLTLPLDTLDPADIQNRLRAIGETQHA
jgi:hypothetical protein